MIEAEPAPQSEPEETEWHNGEGEIPDTDSQNVLQLAYKVVAKFPEMRRRYQVFIGTAAVLSSAALVVTSIAVSRRLHGGQSPDRILEEITPDEIERIAKEKPERPKGKRWSPKRFLH